MPLFPFIGHGLAMARKTMTCMAVFADPVPRARRAPILAGCPELLGETIRWGERCVAVSGFGDALEAGVAAAFGPGDAGWRRFNGDVQAWADDAAAAQPMLFFFQSIDSEYETVTDARHEESVAAIPSLLGATARLEDEHQWVVAELVRLWKEALRRHATHEQKRSIDAIPVEARALFKRHGGLPRAGKRRLATIPTVADALGVFRAVAARESASLRQLEADFASALKATLEPSGKYDVASFDWRNYRVGSLAYVLDEESRWADLNELVACVLRRKHSKEDEEYWREWHHDVPDGPRG